MSKKDQKFRVVTENTSIINEHFIDVVSPDDGVCYEYLDFSALSEEEIANLSEADQKLAENKKILGIAKMSKMQQADISTRNGTVYPLSILAREVKNLAETKVPQKGSYMAADHPGWNEDFRVGFRNSAAFLTKLEIDEKTGIVSGEAVVLDKDAGQDVASTFAAGGFVGVSSRGFGSTKAGDIEGINGPVSGRIIQDNFRLEGFDFVLDPSVPGASVDSMKTEENQNGARSMNRDELKAKFPEVYEAVLAEGKSAAIADLTAEGGSFVPRELHESKVAELGEQAEKLESLQKDNDEKTAAIESKDAEIAELNESKKALEEAKAEQDAALEEAERKSKRAEAEAFVAEALASHPHNEAIKDRLSDEEMATVESAKVALEREQKFLDRLGIPSAPINLEDFSNRTGNAPGNNDETVDENGSGELSESMKRLYTRSGMRLPTDV